MDKKYEYQNDFRNVCYFQDIIKMIDKEVLKGYDHDVLYSEWFSKWELIQHNAVGFCDFYEDVYKSYLIKFIGGLK